MMGKRGDLLRTGTRLSLVDLESVEMPVPAYIRGRLFLCCLYDTKDNHG